MTREPSPAPRGRHPRWDRPRKLAAAALLLLTAASAALLYRPDLPAEQLEDRYAPAPSRFEEVSGVRLHFRDEGPVPDGSSPPPVLFLLHGTAASLHTWNGWVAELGDRYRLVRLDLLGFGLTGPAPDHDYSIESQVELLADLAAHLGVGRMAVAGSSLGGRIAWALAASHPDLVSHLVLVAPAGAPRKARSSEAGPGFRTLDLAAVAGCS